MAITNYTNLYTSIHDTNPRAILGLSTLSLVVSIILHLLFLSLLLYPRSPANREADIVTVQIVPLKELHTEKTEIQKEQIVSTPQNIESKVSPDSPLISDINSITKKQSVRRGEDPLAGLPGERRSINKQTTESKKDIQTPPTDKGQKILHSLKLDEGGLIERYSKELQKPLKEKNERIIEYDSNYKAFSRPLGSGALFLGRNGVTDYLPNLPDGDITLLNTKAALFAVFVRRVATQVFRELRNSGWEKLQAQDINAIEEDSTVRAILSIDGKLRSIQLLSPSGSERFDQVVSNSVKNGAWDPHPPAEARTESGDIIFIFKAKSWVRFTYNPRTGAPIEARWLLLATGLE